MARAHTPKAIETQVLVASRRRCVFCFGLNFDHSPKAGQIAHVDRNAANSSLDNLAWLCLIHHDEYDTKRSQSKGFTPDELRRHQVDLYEFLAELRATHKPGQSDIQLSDEALVLAELLNRASQNGYKFDPLLRIESLPERLSLSANDCDIAIDELKSQGLLELNGSRDFVYATNRLFWATDSLFSTEDPADDAEAVARAIVAAEGDQMGMADLAALMGWAPRRLNPAVSYLIETGNAQGNQALGSAPFWYIRIWRSAATKRLVRDLDRNNVRR